VVDVNVWTHSPYTPPTCVTSSLIKPLNSIQRPHFNALRHDDHNPMIGGPGILLSPPLGPLHNDDSNPPGLTACELETSNASGIDDLNLTDHLSSVKIDLNTEIALNSLNERNIKHIDIVPPVPVTPAPPPSVAMKETRKSSISFMDSSNPLLTTPVLMDLFNADYNMNSTDFLPDNDFEQVLADWPNEIA